jgi:hypothetical protein
MHGIQSALTGVSFGYRFDKSRLMTCCVRADSPHRARQARSVIDTALRSIERVRAPRPLSLAFPKRCTAQRFFRRISRRHFLYRAYEVNCAAREFRALWSWRQMKHFGIASPTRHIYRTIIHQSSCCFIACVLIDECYLIQSSKEICCNQFRSGHVQTPPSLPESD